MSSQVLSRPIQLGALILALLAFFYWFTAPPGPIDPQDAARLARETVSAASVSVDRMDVIAPDGEPAIMPTRLMEGLSVVTCPKIASSSGMLPGRYGAVERIHGSASYECLLRVAGPDDMRFHMAMYVFRSNDPSMPTGSDGFATVLLHPEDVLDLMEREGHAPELLSTSEQQALWAKLARHDIYVPSDKTQKSPLQKAMEAHKKRISSE